MDFIPNAGNFSSEAMREMQLEFTPTDLPIDEIIKNINDIERRIRGLEIEKNELRNKISDRA